MDGARARVDAGLEDAGDPRDAGPLDMERVDAGDIDSGDAHSITYVKASNTNRDDNFGRALALSADGMRLAIGAPGEGSSAPGINGDQADNSAYSAGAVYVFVRSGPTWVQEAYIKASNPGGYLPLMEPDVFGISVSLSADGTRLAVGAIGEGSSASGIDGDQADNSAPDAGAVYVFSRSGTRWAQEAYIKASNPDAGDYFGAPVALSADGTRLAVGARQEDSLAAGIDGDQADDSAHDSGAVYVFARSGTTWTQEAYIKASNTDAYDAFGQSMALSADGTRLAVGASGEGSSAAGIDGDQADDTLAYGGAAYVFSRSGTTWTQEVYIKASNVGLGDRFGVSTSLSADGTWLAIGAERESSSATGVNGDATDDSAPSAGAAYIFARTGTTWTQDAYLKASNTGRGDNFGLASALSADGMRLVVGAIGESSRATGIDGDQADNSVLGSGAAYLFTRSGTNWAQRSYIKASNTDLGDVFGWSVSLSATGTTLAVGAMQEGSGATGVDGDQLDNSARIAGAVYLY